MTKDEILDALEDQRELFLDTIEGLSPEQLQQPGVAGEWSVKDILIHLSSWEAEMVKMIWQIRQAQKPTSMQFRNRPVDEVNAEWFQQYRARPWERAVDDFVAVRKQTVRRVEAFSERELNDPARFPYLKGQPLWEWIANDSFAHEAEHAEQIRAWREQLGV